MPVQPMPYDEDAERYSTLTRIGRELTPEEREFMRNYKKKPATGGFPIGGNIGPMPSGGGMGALHLREGEGRNPQSEVAGDVLNTVSNNPPLNRNLPSEDSIGMLKNRYNDLNSRSMLKDMAIDEYEDELNEVQPPLRPDRPRPRR